MKKSWRRCSLICLWWKTKINQKMCKGRKSYQRKIKHHCNRGLIATWKCPGLLKKFIWDLDSFNLLIYWIVRDVHFIVLSFFENILQFSLTKLHLRPWESSHKRQTFSPTHLLHKKRNCGKAAYDKTT